MGIAWQKLYSSAHWQRRRRLQLLQHPLCKFCLDRGIVTPASVADHVEPHHGNVNKFYLGELQSLCEPCHKNRKRHLELDGYVPDIGLDGWPIDPRHPANRIK
jgi:5-methylcytosine-specific restriction endonuclease McrA